MSENIISNDPNTQTNTSYYSVKIKNNTEHVLFLNKKELLWGFWETEPENRIEPNTEGFFRSHGKLFSGTEGTVQYLIGYGSFDIYWNAPFSGKASYVICKDDPDEIFKITSTEEYDGVILTVEEPK